MISYQLIDTYAKLYYFIPIIRKHELDVDGTTLTLDEPMDAMLWFLDIIASQSEKVYCSRPKLKGLVCRWYGKEASTAFDKYYSLLRKKDFIAPELGREDSRGHDHVRITDKGRHLLNIIKEQRTEPLKLLLEAVQNSSAELYQEVLRGLEVAAHRAWEEMMNVEEFQEGRHTNKKSGRQSNKGRRRPKARKHLQKKK